MKVLVINCGSSSLKYQVLDMTNESLQAKGLVERIGMEGSVITHEKIGNDDKFVLRTPMEDHKAAIALVLDAITDDVHGVVKSMDEIGAVGHRVVHAGEKYAESVLIDDDVIEVLEDCIDLAPLHNPPNLLGIAACKELMPDTPMVAVFDTAFHQTMPPESYIYALPYEYYQKYGIRRYGFHGTSHSYVSKRAAQILGKDIKDLKIIVCHLGNGASISAVKDGKCIDTSMGLTPLEGLIMGTRTGDIDPSVVEFVMKKENSTVADVTNLLNKKSGVYGLSNNLSSDFRDLEDAYLKGDEGAKRAVDAFTYRVAKYIGSYTAAMGGVDVICFTAGVGENSGFTRGLICERLSFLGATVDAEANKVRGEEKTISAADSKVLLMVVPTNEELAIARDTYELCK